MEHSTQVYYWVSGLFPSSGVFGSRNTTFRKLDLFPPSGEGGEDTYLVGPLRNNLKHWTNPVRFAELFNYSTQVCA
jgi:hypothetical protein